MSNSLAAVHPELVAEWSEKNLPLTPDSITFGSNKKVWWKGACGHEWQTSVKARSNGEKCPICSGARVIAGINDLATLEPLLEKQWSKKNKIIRMRKLFNEGNLTTEAIHAVMSEEKPNQKEKIVLRGDRVRQLIPKNIPVSQTEDFVCKALEHYNKFLRNRAERDSR